MTTLEPGLALRSSKSLQREVTEMIGSDLEFEVVAGHQARRCHYSGVVDQEIKAFVEIGGQAVGEHLDRIKGGEIETADLDLCVSTGGSKLRTDLGHCGVSLLLVAAGEYHPRPVARKLAAFDQADATVATGHDGRAAAQVRNVIGSPAVAHGGEAIRPQSQAINL